MTASTRTVSTLLFDWDGTVVDSAQLGLTAYEKAFAELGIPFDHDTYRLVYSPNWLSVYEGLGLPKEHWQRADDLWTHHYGQLTAGLIEGAGETLVQLREKGYRMGVVSSGNDCRVNREIDELGLSGFFEVVICHEQISNRKPHPEGLEIAMRVLGSAKNDVGYVGDTPEDIEMGKGAGVLTIGVRSDYPTSWKLELAQPDLLIESLTELTDHF
ncbi:MAG TPA: HAD family hydrolase [Pyrinomonadaceae bacterium]|nr:HAD family hydrolase [Pyrinomonadaceae bacterium]